MAIIVTKAERPEAIPEAVNAFKVQYTKEATLLDGKKVVVIDDQRMEYVTFSQLNAKKAELQKAITEIDTKLAEIEKIS